MIWRGALTVFCMLTFAVGPRPAAASDVARFTVGWSGHVDWAPWSYAQTSGIAAKWSEKLGVEIEIVRAAGHRDSLDRFASGEFHAVAASDIDALEVTSRHAITATAVVLDGFSSGNDGIVVKKGGGVADLKGKKVYLERYSEVHYLLDRCLEKAGLSESDVEIVDTLNGAIVDAFAKPEVEVAGSWNPYLAELLQHDGAEMVCDSSEIPGEIIDLMIANEAVLLDNPALGTALAGIWRETLAAISAPGAAGDAARAETAALLDISAEEFMREMSAVRLLTPEESIEMMSNPGLRNSIAFVRRFLFTRDLLGPEVSSIDDIGIELGDGYYIGNPEKLRLRFDPSYGRAAAELR